MARGLALTRAVLLIVLLVCVVVGRRADVVPAVLVDITVVEHGDVAAADHDWLGLRRLIGVVRPVVRLVRRLVGAARAIAAASALARGLALTRAVLLIVLLVGVVRGRRVHLVAAVLIDVAVVEHGDVRATDPNRVRVGRLVRLVVPLVRLVGGLLCAAVFGSPGACGLTLTCSVGLVVRLIC